MASTYVRPPAGGVDNLLLCCDSYKVRLHVTCCQRRRFSLLIMKVIVEGDLINVIISSYSADGHYCQL